MKNKKIGLCMAFTGTNYGMLLQAYATQYVIKKLGYNTEIIHYISKGNRKVNFEWEVIFFGVKILIRKFKRRLCMRREVLSEIHQKNILERKKISDEFRKTRLSNIRTCIGVDNLFKAGAGYSAVLIGSDQLWLPGSTLGNFYSLRFVPDHITKISYATSLGVSRYPHYCRKSAFKVWNRFQFLSVREEQGKQIIESICKNINVKVVVDPTYLLSKQNWHELIGDKKMHSEKYILCYFLGNSIINKECARNFANANNLKLISILSDESQSSIDISYADKIVIGASPEDFINWIRGASYVFTDSFHGIAFSIINEKQVFILYRNSIGDRNSRNSRIDNILEKWNIEDHLVLNPNIEWDKTNVSDINYNDVSPLVENLRQESYLFLNNALSRI